MNEDLKELPAFSLEDQDGRIWTNARLKGKKAVLYFYPKDSTPGCTMEACHFRDEHSAFEKRGVQVFGVSADSVKSHAKFAGKHGLPFPLLSDPDKVLIGAFDLWQKKGMFGISFMGVQRSTVLVDEKGRILKCWPKVKISTHTQDVLDALG